MPKLTTNELRAVLEAIGQMTSGNAYDYSSWKEQTGGSWAEWKALLRGEEKLRALLPKP